MEQSNNQRAMGPASVSIIPTMSVTVIGAIQQRQTRLGPAKYPGRQGIVLEANPCEPIGRRGGLWYVRLAPRGRAAERVEMFFGDELNPL